MDENETNPKGRDLEAYLRALWSEKGVSPERQDQLIADITAKAQPGARVGPFTIPAKIELTEIGEQYVMPGCERKPTPKRRQLGLWE